MKRREFKPCAVIPTFDNPRTILGVVKKARQHLDPVIVVDDGSAEPARSVIEDLNRAGAARVWRLRVNSGKGAALLAGFHFARELGYTHAFQIDGDGQHDLESMPNFLDVAARRPDALVLGYPVFNATVPAVRKSGRAISRFWVNVETRGKVVADPMTGFRVYPVEETIACRARGRRMEFDIEVAVRMVWAGVPVINLPVGVRYLSAEEGGVSHFRMFRDNVRISWTHARLTARAILRNLG